MVTTRIVAPNQKCYVKFACLLTGHIYIDTSIACQVGYTQQWLWLEQRRFVPKIEVPLSWPLQLIYFQEESMSCDCVLLLWDSVVVVPSHCNLPVCTATLWLGGLSQFCTPQTTDTALYGTSVRVFPRGGTKSEKEIDVLYDFIYLVTGHSDVSTPGGECYGSSSSDSRWVWITLFAYSCSLLCSLFIRKRNVCQQWESHTGGTGHLMAWGRLEVDGLIQVGPCLSHSECMFDILCIWLTLKLWNLSIAWGVYSHAGD